MLQKKAIMFIVCLTLLSPLTACKKEKETHAYYYYEGDRENSHVENVAKNSKEDNELVKQEAHTQAVDKKNQEHNEAMKEEPLHTQIQTQKVYTRNEQVKTPEEAIELLKEGNERFISGKILNKEIDENRRKNLSINGQKPFVAILSCSDSRVPPELIFDQALGDVFVIRNAGNVVDPVMLGSIEYGAEHLKIPLMLVLGHEKCGAVKATVEGGEVPPNIGSIVEKIRTSLEKVKNTTNNKDELVENCCVENIKNSMAQIMESHVLKELEESKKIEVMGAKYDVDTGEVTYLSKE